MKSAHKGLFQINLTTVTVLIVVSLIFQSFSPNVQNASAKAQNLITGASNQATVDEVFRPSIAQQTGIVGKRHSAAELYAVASTAIESIQSVTPPPILFTENMGQFNNQERFEARLNNSIIRFE